MPRLLGCWDWYRLRRVIFRRAAQPPWILWLRCATSKALTLRFGVKDGNAASGCALRIPDAGEESWVHRGRRGHAGLGHWCEYGDVQRREFSPVGRVAISRLRPGDGGVEDDVERRPKRFFNAGILGNEATGRSIGAHGCILQRKFQSGRERRPGANCRWKGQLRSVPSAWDTAGIGTNIFAGRRSSWRRPCRDFESRALEITFWIASRHIGECSVV